MATNRRGRGTRRGNLLATVAFAALAVVLAAAAVVYYRDGDDAPDDPPPPPSPVAGVYNLANLADALRTAGLGEVGYGRGTVELAALTPPGQILTVADATLYVFIYADARARQADARALEGVDPTTLIVTRPSGTPVPTEGLTLAQGANALVAISGGSSATVAEVQRAVEGLT